MTVLDFEYDNEKLSDYGMMLCTFNGSSIETISSGADLTFHQISSCQSNKFYLYSSSYENVFSTTFQICKNPRYVHMNDEMVISTSEISALQRWLNRKQYHKFKIYQKDYEHLYWNATFTCKQIMLCGNIVGLELTLYTDAPYAYMDEIVIEKICNTNNYQFDIYDASDEEGFIYPDVNITFFESGNFILTNSLSNKITKINNCSIGETIILNGSEQIISTSISSHKSLFDDFNYFFPKIINTYSNNKNIFTSNLKCKITLSYSPIRKVGL